MDETTKLLMQAGRDGSKGASVFPMSAPVWNIDDVDGRMYMINHDFSGCYALLATKAIDPAHRGTLLIDGVPAGEVRLGPGYVGMQGIGLFLRGTLREYDREYRIEYKDALDLDGIPVAPYTAVIRTLSKRAPGEVWPEHDRLVLQAAREGIVLMKNENGTLPLGKGAALNAFGSGAAIFRLGTVGAGKINPRYGIRLERGVKEYSSLQLNDELFSFYTQEKECLPPEEMLARAREKSGTAVYVLTRGTGESIDNRPEKGEYKLTDAERALMAALRERFEKLAVVLNTGYPIEMDWAGMADAILWVGLPGMAGGQACAEILEGTISPSGRLPDSWAVQYEDIPASRNFNIPGPGATYSGSDQAPSAYSVIAYEEGLYVGYRYFSTFGKKPAFPFGHGLSYTRFAKKVVRFTESGGLCEMKVRVRNTGSCPGKETVLLFARIPDGKLEQPERRLVAFGKTQLLYPGASEDLELTVPPLRFDSYDPETAQWVLEPGQYTLYLGGSAEEAEEAASFALSERMVLQTVKNRVTCPVQLHTMSKREPDYWPEGKLSAIVESSELPYRRKRARVPETDPVKGSGASGGLITFPMVKENPGLLGDFVLQLSDEQLCRMSVGARTGWGPEDSGFAGTLYTDGVLKELELPEYYFSDGNNGLNMNEPNIGFPTSNLIAATFNEALSYEEGRAIAAEAKGMQLQNILAPSINIHRNPLCGRQAEYFSEDPLLAGRMGGMESKGLEAEGVASCVKHFIANNAETLRNTAHALIDERTMREIYLKAFEYALDVHQPDSMMTGYNPTNGCWCAGDPELLQGILREEWGYEGYVMTDWGSSTCCNAVDSAEAGNSWVAPGEMDNREVDPMVKAIADGRLSRERVRKNVYRMMQSLIRY